MYALAADVHVNKTCIKYYLRKLLQQIGDEPGLVEHRVTEPDILHIRSPCKQIHLAQNINSVYIYGPCPSYSSNSP